MVQESQVAENIAKQLKEWNIKVSPEMVNQQIKIVNAKLKIMNDLAVTTKDTTKLKTNLVKISLKNNKAILDRLSKL